MFNCIHDRALEKFWYFQIWGNQWWSPIPSVCLGAQSPAHCHEALHKFWHSPITACTGISTWGFVEGVGQHKKINTSSRGEGYKVNRLLQTGQSDMFIWSNNSSRTKCSALTFCIHISTLSVQQHFTWPTAHRIICSHSPSIDRSFLLAFDMLLHNVFCLIWQNWYIPDKEYIVC